MAWIMQDNRPVETDSITNPNKAFIDDSPYIMWRINPNANDGRPYQGLMIGVPVLASETAPESYYGDNKLPAMYYGDIPIYKAYYGITQIEN